VVTEDERVFKTVAALEARNIGAVGRLLNEGHASLRDDYCVSIPQIDKLVGIAQQHAAVFGARMTGGGFGGSIVALAQSGWARQAADEIREAYTRIGFEEPATVLVPAG
jgi:galactokinase